MSQKKWFWNFQNYRFNSLGDILILISFLLFCRELKKNTFVGFSLIATLFVLVYCVRILWNLPADYVGDEQKRNKT
jgi:hypothetical protein